MVFTASKHGPEGHTPLHARPGGSLVGRWRHRQGPLLAPEHTLAHADARDTGTLENVLEQLSNSGISKQVGRKIFFFFFFFYYVFFFFFFFSGLVNTFGRNKRELFFLFQKIIFLELIKFSGTSSGNRPHWTARRTRLCAFRWVHGSGRYAEAPHRVSLPAPARKQKSTVVRFFPHFFLLFSSLYLLRKIKIKKKIL